MSKELQYRAVERSLQYKYDQLYTLNVSMGKCLEDIETLISTLKDLEEGNEEFS